MISRRGVLVGALALALPGRALAARAGHLGALLDPEPAEGALVSEAVPLGRGRALQGGARVLPAREAPPFTLVGAHWRGRARVWVRTASGPGAFGPWRVVDCCEGPDDDPPQSTLPRGSLGKPVWTGPGDRVQFRVAGQITDLRAHYLLSEPVPTRHLTVVGTPSIIPRAGWHASERIVRAAPWEVEHLRLAIVHHTAGERPATPEESAAIIRGIQRYHVKANGWNDIGYNFLVDPFGQAFEGRGGGVEQNVVGAHARGFNTGAVGVAVLGDYQHEQLTPEARTALVSLLAWRLDVGHLDPQTLPTVVSGGTSRYPDGAPISLRAVSGHRDTDLTVCPGDHLYPEIGSIAAEAAALGGPKLYEPRADGRLGGPVRLTGRLSEDLPWTVTVTDGAGNVVAQGAGAGSAIDWTWDATGIEDGGFGYVMAAGEAVRSAVGVILEPEPPPEPLPPPRPKGVPRRVPRWAFDLYVWHNRPRGQRGRRPSSAPRRPPRWYWKWRRWRLARARFFTERARLETSDV